jgi:SPP1 gp7 family putative phage head morphogenesis protein
VTVARRRPRSIQKADRAAQATAAGATVFTPQEVAAIATAIAGQTSPSGPVTALPRQPQLAATPFGPGVPLIPAAINPPRPDSGRPEPRAYEYAVTSNLPGVGDKLVPWSVLRQAADGITIFRKCIEIRKDEFSSLDLDVVVSKKAISRELRTAGGTPRAELEQQMQTRLAPDIARLTDWWQEPDRRNGESWIEWIKKLLEERFVLDAAAIYPRHTYGGDLYSFEILDGSTIKPLLDADGGRPMPPSAAYQQILWGFPRGEFVADLGEDGLPPGVFPADQLIYERDNVRSWTPYGYSSVERALTDGALYVQRNAWMLAVYTDGVMPSGWLKAGEGQANWTVDQLSEYERLINDYYAGITSARQRLRILPYGMEPVEVANEAEKYKPEYDLHLLKLCAGHFQTTIAELGFTDVGGLGSTGYHEGQADVQDRKATRPTVAAVEALLNKLSRRHLGMPAELEIKFSGDDAEDVGAEDEIADRQVKGGRMTINEDRDRRGLARFAFPEADKPFILGGTGGVTFLEGAEERAQQAANQAQMLADAKANPPKPDDEQGDDGNSGLDKPDDNGPDDGGGLNKLEDADLVKAEVAAYARWARKNPNPRRPFTVQYAQPTDFADPDPARLEFDEWVWDGGLDKADWKPDLHPRDHKGRFRKRTLSELVHHLEGKHGNDRSKYPARARRALAEAEAEHARHHRRTEDRIRAAVAEHEDRPGGWVPLAKIRESLHDVSREDVDAELKRLAVQPGVHLIPWDNQNALGTEDRAAALRFGGQENHALRFDPTPAEPAKPPKFDETPEVHAARSRQERIDRAMAMAEMAGEVEEAHHAMQGGSPEVMARRVRAMANRHGAKHEHTQALATVIESHAAEGDTAAILRSTRGFAAEHGLTRIGNTGDRERLDYARHHAPSFLAQEGAKAGDEVEIVKPGYEFTDPETAEKIRLTRPAVDTPLDTTPVKPKRTRTPRKAAAKPPAVRGEPQDPALANDNTPAVDDITPDELAQARRGLVDEHNMDQQAAGALDEHHVPSEPDFTEADVRLRALGNRRRAAEPTPGLVESDAEADLRRARERNAANQINSRRRRDPGFLAGDPEAERIARTPKPTPQEMGLNLDRPGAVEGEVVDLHPAHGGAHEIEPVTSRPKVSHHDPADVAAHLAAHTSREQAASHLDSLKLSAPQMKQLAKDLDVVVPGGASKQRIRDEIVDQKVGVRLRAHAIEQTSTARRAGGVYAEPTPAQVRDAAAEVAQFTPGQDRATRIRALLANAEHMHGSDRSKWTARERRDAEKLERELAKLEPPKTSAADLARKTAAQQELAAIQDEIDYDDESGGVLTGHERNRLEDRKDRLQQEIDELDARTMRKADESDPKVSTPPDQRWPAWAVDEALAAVYAPLILAALAGGLTTLAAAQALAERWLAAAEAHQGLGAATWLEEQGWTVEPALAPVLDNLYTEAAYVGQQSATAAVAEDIRLAVSLEVDWGNWTPGDPEAARLLLDPEGLQRLLDRFGITIRSIAAHRLDELAGILGHGLQNGDSSEEIAHTIQHLTANAAQAYRIAVTETARAISAAAVAQYEADGIATKGWLHAADQDVCELCQANEDAGDIPLTDLFPSGEPFPPAHPHCRCAVIPGLDLEGAAE